jgi:type II secretory pathway component PulK
MCMRPAQSVSLVFSFARRTPRVEKGFVLVATLFAVALIALGAAYFANRVNELRNNAIDMQRWAEAERDAFSIRETLLHAAAIYPRDNAGLMVTNESFATDNRPYKVSASATLRVQDERGLIGINVLDDKLLIKFFSSLGIPSNQHMQLLDGLRDYIDPDDLKHLNGAEKNDYIAAKLAPPTNDFLRSREQLMDVMAWRQIFASLNRLDSETAQQSNVSSLQDVPQVSGIRDRFLSLFSTAKHFGINANTAPATVLSLLPGLNPARINALIDQRRARQFNNLAELIPFANGPLDEELIGLVGSDTWRVTIAKSDLPFLLECQLVITPGAKDRPTRLKECRRRSPDLFLTGAPNEFIRALDAQKREPLRPVTLPTKSINEPNFADRNLRRDPNRTDETPAPRWLAESIATVAPN